MATPLRSDAQFQILYFAHHQYWEEAGMRGNLFIKYIKLSAILVMALGALILSQIGSAQQEIPTAAGKPRRSPPIYNPYPPGILPPDLESELDRVRSELNSIFNQALEQWRALSPPTLTGQPPILQ